MDFSNLHILVVGDIMIDQYIYGEINRISPEAPVSILDQNSREYKLGGAANVAANLVTLSSNATLVGVVGMDDEQSILQELLTQHSIEAKLITDSDRPTTLKTRLVARNQQVLRVDRESKLPISKSVEDDLLSAITSLIAAQQFDAVILQDYNKGVLTRRVINAVITQCNNHRIKVMVDPKFENIDAYDHAYFLKPNKKEALTILSCTTEQFDQNIEAYCGQLLRDLDLDEVWITLGADGVVGMDKSGQFVSAKTTTKDVVDVCGAGDAVIAILTLLSCGDTPLQEKASATNTVGEIVCSKSGVVNVGYQEYITQHNATTQH